MNLLKQALLGLAPSEVGGVPGLVAVMSLECSHASGHLLNNLVAHYGQGLWQGAIVLGAFIIGPIRFNS